MEKIAELLNEKKLPLVGDVRDKSAEDIRLVIEPSSRAVDPELMMESLFKLTELESRIPLNMNVLVKGRIPKVLGLAERCGMARPSARRAAAPLEPPASADRAPARNARRLSDRLSQPRQGDQDHPHRGRAETGADEELQTDRGAGRRHPQHAAAQSAQARGNGNPHRGQGPARRAERIKELLRLGDQQWKTIAEQVKAVRDTFGPKTPLGKRRTHFADAPEHDLAAIEEALVEREPITVVVSEKGWVRTLKGQVADLSGLAFKTDDGSAPRSSPRPPRSCCCSRPTATSTPSMRPSCRADAAMASRSGCSSTWSRTPIVSLFVNKGGRKFLVASHEGRASSSTRTTASAIPARASRCSTSIRRTKRCAVATVDGDMVAVIGDNRKMLVFPIDQVPEMARGRGVRLQRYKDGGLVRRHHLRRQERPDLDAIRPAAYSALR